jgi:hypothetical protein
MTSRVAMGAVIAALAAGCTRAPSSATPAPVAMVRDAGVDAPVSAGLGRPGIVGPLHLVARDVQMIAATPPLRWQTRDGRVQVLDPAGTAPVTLGVGEALAAPVADDRAWYQVRCVAGCDAEVDARRHVIERVDRASGDRTVLAEDVGVVALVGWRDELYWGTQTVEWAGALRRVPKAGGRVEAVWGERIASLAAYPDGVLAVGTNAVGWIGAGQRQARTLSKRPTRVRAATLAAGAVFVADWGDYACGSDNDGHVDRIARQGGPPVVLADQVRGATAVAAHGDRVYFMRNTSITIWAVPRTGGTPIAAVVADPAAAAPLGPVALWADDRGLFALLATVDTADHGDLYFVPWADVTR